MKKFKDRTPIAYLIRINKKSIKRNPDAGRTNKTVQGKSHVYITQLVVQDIEQTILKGKNTPTTPPTSREFVLQDLVDGRVTSYKILSTERDIDMALKPYGGRHECLRQLWDGKIDVWQLDKREEKDTQNIAWLTPAPDFLCKYVPTKVECYKCGATFTHTDLQADASFEGSCTSTKCPKCGVWDCCELEYEKLTKETTRVR